MQEYTFNISSETETATYVVHAQSMSHAVEQVLDIVNTHDSIVTDSEYNPYTQKVNEEQKEEKSYEGYTSYIKQQMAKLKENFPICFSREEQENSNYKPYKK